MGDTQWADWQDDGAMGLGKSMNEVTLPVFLLFYWKSMGLIQLHLTLFSNRDISTI